MALPVALKGFEEHSMFYLALMVSLWFFALVPLWGSVLFMGLRLRHQSLLENDPRPNQFGIRQLMVFTGFVAVLLGVGRLLVATGWIESDIDRGYPFLIVLIAAQVLISVPLIFATLLPRRWLAGVLLALLFIVLVTIGEIPLAKEITKNRPSPELEMIAWINFFSAVWVLIFAVIVRGSGYGCGVVESR